jgi:hypothetical protein
MVDRRRSCPPKYLIPVVLVCFALAASGSADAMPPSSASQGLIQNGEVLETMAAAGYTYVRVRTDEGEIWAAGPETPLEVGDHVNLGSGALMPAFHSKALDRTFDAIYFVGAIDVVGRSGGSGQAVGMPTGHAAAKTTTAVAAGSLEKAVGGSTIAELYSRRQELSGETVLVRGEVVKYTSNIMGRNWLHIQDGTGESGSDDLTVTTPDSARVGDVVVVQGTAAVDKDFGAGYRYALIVEQANLKVE